MKKTQHFKAHSKTFLVLSVLFITIFLIQFASAEFLSVKTDVSITKDSSILIGTEEVAYKEVWTKYQPIEIKDVLGLGNTLFKGAITNHTETCGDSCLSEMTIYLPYESVLIEDLIFYKIVGTNKEQRNIRSWKLQYYGLIDDYKEVCVEGKEIYNEKNETYYTPITCSNVLVGNHYGWVDYKIGDKMKAGTYNVRLIGSKNPSWNVDWVIKTAGKTLDEWAIWGNISLGDTAEIKLNSPADGSTQYNKLVTFNASANVTNGAYLVNMSLYTNETGSWSVKNSTNYSSFNLISYYTLDESSGTTTYDTIGNNNGTNNGALVNQIGIINKSYDFELNELDYVNIGSNTIDVTSSPLSINAWIKLESLPASAQQIIGGNTTANSYSFYVHQDTPHYMAFGKYGVNEIKSTTAVGTGAWHMVTMVYNGSYVAFYVNGTLAGVSPYTSTFSSGITYYLGQRFDGIMDEVGVWNKFLTESQISSLYNSGNANRDISLTYSNNLFYNTYSSGQVIKWNVQACDSDGDCGFALNNRTFIMDSTAPQITLNYPVGTIDYGKLNSSLQLNFSVTDTNLDKCAVSYYQNPVNPAFMPVQGNTYKNNTEDNFVELYSTPLGGDPLNPILWARVGLPSNCSVNGTITITNTGSNIICGDDTIIYDEYIPRLSVRVYDLLDSCSTENDSLLNISLGTSKQVAIYANDTIGNLNTTTFSWDYRIFENNRTYQVTEYETNKSIFILNLTRGTGYSINSPYLNYNGTEYIITNITNSGSNSLFYKEIDIPLNNNFYSSQNRTFYWRFNTTIDSTTTQVLTDSSIQTVNPLILTSCNTTYPTKALNLTAYNELNQNNLVAITIDSAFNFWMGSGSIIKNYYYQNLTGISSNYNFCINPNVTIQTNAQISYTNTGYVPRTYYLNNASLTNTTSLIKLLMLNNTEATKFYFTVEKDGIRLTNATVTISKKNIGTGNWDVVGIRETDSLGEFIEYLELDKEHSFSVVKDADLLGTIYRTSSCSSAPCLVTLQVGEGADYNVWNGYYDIYAPNVVYTLEFDKDSKIVNYTFIDVTGLATYFRLQVDKIALDNSTINLCNETLYATQGTITCNLSTQTGNFVAKGVVSRSPEKIVAIITGILSSIADTIGKNLGLFLAFLFIIVVGFVGMYNPVVGIILTAVAFTFSVILGLVSVSLTSVILIVILAILLIIKNGRYNV